MASPKEYAYYVVGNQIGIVEKDVNFDNDPNSKDYGPGIEKNAWKSPLSSVADGLKLEYLYSPIYFIESTDVSTSTVSGWDQDNDGNFRLRASGSTDWTSSPNLSSVTYIVLSKAGRFNGLHKVSSVTNNRIVTATKVSASTSETLFEETVVLYYDVNVLNDESDTIDIAPYLAKALVYFVKAKMAEDMRDMEGREYFMREFRIMVEKHQSSLIKTGRFISSGAHSIR